MQLECEGSARFFVTTLYARIFGIAATPDDPDNLLVSLVLDSTLPTLHAVTS